MTAHFEDGPAVRPIEVAGETLEDVLLGMLRATDDVALHTRRLAITVLHGVTDDGPPHDGGVEYDEWEAETVGWLRLMCLWALDDISAARLRLDIVTPTRYSGVHKGNNPAQRKDKNMTNEVQIGTISVDAGIVMIGDPCYRFDNPLPAANDWDAFVGATLAAGDRAVSQPLGNGCGIVVPTGWGDGEYPVTATFVNGRIVSVTIDFDPPADDDEEEDDDDDWGDDD
jgi:hypothetical protein